jgi:hypothetical protein
MQRSVQLMTMSMRNDRPDGAEAAVSLSCTGSRAGATRSRHHRPSRETWLAEFEAAKQERRHVTYTMHPEVIGRAHRANLLDELITRMSESAAVWFATHGDVAAFVVR